MPNNGEMKYGGFALGRIHAKSNRRKAEAYWLGFLEGVLASESIESLEIASIRAEAEQFLHLFGDEDAADLIQDLNTTYRDYHDEIFGVISGIVDYRSKPFGVDSSSKDSCNRFFGFCAGIACDGRLKIKEVEKLIRRIDQAPALGEDARITSLRSVASEAISDGYLSSEEEEDIGDWIARLVGDSCADTGMASYGNGRITDEAYLGELEAIERDADDYLDHTRAIERALKDRIRAELGLQPRPQKADVNLAQHARNNGITPSYELPARQCAAGLPDGHG